MGGSQSLPFAGSFLPLYVVRSGNPAALRYAFSARTACTSAGSTPLANWPPWVQN